MSSSHQRFPRRSSTVCTTFDWLEAWILQKILRTLYNCPCNDPQHPHTCPSYIFSVLKMSSHFLAKQKYWCPAFTVIYCFCLCHLMAVPKVRNGFALWWHISECLNLICPGGYWMLIVKCWMLFHISLVMWSVREVSYSDFETLCIWTAGHFYWAAPYTVP